jgi:hypothetical protein
VLESDLLAWEKSGFVPTVFFAVHKEIAIAIDHDNYCYLIA